MNFFADKNEVETFQKGLLFLKNQTKVLPNKSGVYKFYNHRNEVIYIGKARYISKRIASYTLVKKLSNRHINMISEINNLEIIFLSNNFWYCISRKTIFKFFIPIVC